MHKLVRVVCIGAALGLAGACFVAHVETASAQSSQQAGGAKKSAKKSANRPAASRGNAASSQGAVRNEFAPNPSGMADRHDARNGY